MKRLARVDNEGRVHSTGLVVRHGEVGQTNARAGTVVLVAGVATITTSALTEDSEILFSVKTKGGTQGFLSLQSVNPMTGTFDITSTSTSETSSVFWMIVDKQ
jgi:hypothetical protein